MMLGTFEKQVKWRWVLRGHDAKPSILVRRKGNTTGCNQIVDPMLSAWLSYLRMSMMKAVKSSASYANLNRPSNLIPLAAWAIKLMKASKWHIEMIDKMVASVFLSGSWCQSSMTKSYQRACMVKCCIAKSTSKE